MKIWIQSVITGNQDEISSGDETHSTMKKSLFTREFHPRMKRFEFHHGVKFSLKENLQLNMKTYNKIYLFFSVIERITLLEDQETQIGYI